MLTSCDMDLKEPGTLDVDGAVDNVEICLQLRNGLYINLRSMGTAIGTTSIQGDEFYGITINGNVLSNVTSGNILSNDSDLAGIWSSCYGVIASANYFLIHAEALLNNEEIVLSTEDQQRINWYIGEAKFVRAYAYYLLTERYCNSYTKIDPEGAITGVPIRLDFNPSNDQSTYPGRSSLAAVYALIDKDLKESYEAISEWENIPDYPDMYTGQIVINHKQYLQTASPILNSWVVKAMQCRMALLKGQYEDAKTLAQEIIASPLYSLCTRSNYENMWAFDNSTEIIYMPYADNSAEPAAALGTNWNSTDPKVSFFIPTADVVNNLYTSRDIRLSVFLSTRNLNVDGSQVETPIFNKYPGNSSLNINPNGGNELRNKSKMFRLSETYLILAEACYETGDETGANQALKDLRSQRILLNPSTVYTGTELRDQIRLERRRELIGEGFRISDLRRWGLGFDRTDVNYVNPDVAGIIVVASRIVYGENDYRYVWPIPASEMEVNPQIKGQQNPGYGN